MKKIIQLSIASALLATTASVQAEEVAQIISLSGDAVVIRDTHKYFAQRGMVLEQGDIVRSLRNGKVKLRYSDCESYVESGREVVVSKSEPCAFAKVAKASDLQSPTSKNYKIQRIDKNLAEAKCNACKVDLASGAAVAALPSGGLFLPAAGVAGLAAIARDGGSSTPVTPTSTPDTPDTPDTPTETPDTPDMPDTPTETPDTPDTPDTPTEMPDTPDTPDTPTDTPDTPDTPMDTPDDPPGGSNDPVSPM